MRLSGQDAERGTFAHRHLVFHDPYTGETYAPIQHLPAANASFEVYNSPLSEYAALGFEYGYSVAAPDALVLWEAQFGDFVNGAQIVIDQFLVAGRSKWGQTSRLTLSCRTATRATGRSTRARGSSGSCSRARRTTSGSRTARRPRQFFHLLRRQALDATARPLVVMTPKGLLRLKHAASTLEELATGSFQPVIPDPTAGHDVRRLVLCSGKVYYDIVGHDARPGATDVAVARLEQLYPFPVEAVAELIATLPNLEEIVWAQEEPQNMGAWRRSGTGSTTPPARAHRSPGVTYVGRSWRASPSEGYPTAHQLEQDRSSAPRSAPPAA